MTDSPKLAQAKLNAAAARERVTQTLGQLQAKVSPKTLARNAARDLTDAGTAAASASVETVRRNPGIIAGATAVAGLFLARHRIAALFHREQTDAPEPDA